MALTPRQTAVAEQYKQSVTVTSGRGQNHVWKLRSRGDLGHPAVVALQGPSNGHLFGHLCARYRSMAVD